MTVPGIEPGTRRPRRHYSPRWTRIGLMALAVFLVVTVTSMAATVFFLGRFHNTAGITKRDGEPFPPPKSGERVNVLVMGLDAEFDPETGKVVHSGFDRRRSDVMMLVSGDPVTKQVSVISIPRDTRVEIPGHGWSKINAAHAIGGPGLAMETVEKFLGIKVHYYVRTNFEGLAHLVDSIGGVEYTVEKPMKYSDPYQALFIDLKPGKQVLDGDHAVQYVRYRSDGDDITRVGRQQKFLRAVVDQTLTLGNVLKIPRIINDMTKYIDTNLNAGDILQYAGLATGLNDADLKTEMVPGQGDGVSYWLPDLNATKAMVDRLIRGVDPVANAKIRVEVLNGTAATGQATRLADALREDGFTVVRVANADKKNYTRTVVIDHRGDTDNVERLGKTIRDLIAKPGFKTTIDKDGQADFTIIVGTDYK